MHEIGTVRTSLVFRELQRHRDTVEGSLCAVRPYWISPCRSKNGCWPSCAMPATTACWLCMSCCCAPPGGRRPRLPRVWGQVLKYDFLSCSRCTILLIVG